MSGNRVLLHLKPMEKLVDKERGLEVLEVAGRTDSNHGCRYTVLVDLVVIVNGGQVWGGDGDMLHGGRRSATEKDGHNRNHLRWRMG